MTPAERDIWLRAVLSRIAGKPADAVAADADLEDAIGLDSLGRLETLSEIEDEFDFFFDDAALTTCRTIARMHREIERHTRVAAGEPAE